MKNRLLLTFFISVFAASVMAAKPNGKCRIKCTGGSASCGMIGEECHCTCD